jgi:hypothetical protein
MNKVLRAFMLLLVVFPAFNFSGEKIVYESKPIIIAELFTSEGCSSCPSAEQLLKEMADMTSKEAAAVVGLAFHITYWDHLGWKDPFSQQEFTDRQKKYDQFLTTQQYTPQVVVNGEFEFVGGNVIAFRDAVTKAANAPYYFSIAATAIHSNNKITIDYSVNKKSKSELLNVALVETSVENHVKSGENKNRVLKHYNVVRKFQTVDLEPGGQLTMETPPDIDLSKCGLVLYVQHRRNLKVMGASQILLKQE